MSMPDIESLSDKNLARFFVNWSWTASPVDSEVDVEIRRRFVFLAGWYACAHWLIETGTNFETPGAIGHRVGWDASREDAYRDMMRQYTEAVEKIAAGNDPTEVFASMSPPRPAEQQRAE